MLIDIVDESVNLKEMTIGKRIEMKGDK